VRRGVGIDRVADQHAKLARSLRPDLGPDEKMVVRVEFRRTGYYVDVDAGRLTPECSGEDWVVEHTPRSGYYEKSWFERLLLRLFRPRISR